MYHTYVALNKTPGDLTACYGTLLTYRWLMMIYIYHIPLCSHCIPIVFPLYSHCIPIVFPLYSGWINIFHNLNLAANFGMIPLISHDSREVVVRSLQFAQISPSRILGEWITHPDIDIWRLSWCVRNISHYPLVNIQKALEHGTFIVDSPIKNADFP